MISDYFPKSQRGLAVGIYGIGGFGGIGLSYLIGGAVLATFRGVDTRHSADRWRDHRCGMPRSSPSASSPCCSRC